MKSYKCPQCGFVTSITLEKCKICGLPNINVNPAIGVRVAPQIYAQSSAATYSFLKTADDNVRNTLPLLENFSEPICAEGDNKSKTQKNVAANSLFAPYTLDAYEMEMTEKDINLAWKAGRVWCFLIGATTILMLLAFFLDSSTADLPAVLLAFLMTTLMLIAGGILSYGVYLKNRLCASVLIFLAGVSIILNLWNVIFTQDIGGLIRLILACVFGYYFALGVRGTFKYHKLMT